MKRLILLVAGSLLCFSTAYSAPVDIPLSLKNTKDESKVSENKPVGLGAAAEAEWLNRRKLKIGGVSGGNKLEGQFYSGKAILTVDLLGKWDWYAFAGVGRDLKLKDVSLAGNNVDFEFDDNVLAWGAGANYLIYSAPEYYGLGIFADAKYRRLDNFDLDKINVNGTQASTVTKSREPRWQEWQVALGAAAKLNYVVPFAGVTYSDTSIKAEAIANGTTYKVSDTRNKDRFGGFAGFSIVPNDFVSVDLEARFVDEEAITGKVNVKF